MPNNKYYRQNKRLFPLSRATAFTFITRELNSRTYFQDGNMILFGPKGAQTGTLTAYDIKGRFLGSARIMNEQQLRTFLNNIKKKAYAK